MSSPVNVPSAVVTPIPNQSATQGTAWNYAAPAGTFNDPNGDPPTYSASDMPAWMVFTPATRRFSGTPSVIGSFTVTANDAHGHTVVSSFLRVIQK